MQYAKQVKGRKMYGGQSTVIPIKISGSGVMPLIFAFALISLPDLIMGLFWERLFHQLVCAELQQRAGHSRLAVSRSCCAC